MLPNFLFLVPLAPAAAAPPSQPAGTPLPPGTVTARNTWNQTLTCPPPSSSSQPLEPLSSWNTTLSIPALLFMGQPQGSNIRQSFSLSSSGAFSVSDDHGNSFAFTLPITANGTSRTSSLVGNSTTAVYETRVAAGPIQLADLKLTFSFYRQFCQPAGVRLLISGSEVWGPSGLGIVRILFDRHPVSLTGFRAWFGNTTGVALGFDWSDSKARGPTFDAKSSSLNYKVGSSFEIDPVTVGTTSNNGATANSFEGRVLRANGLFWVFYPTTSSASESYSTSPTGLTWSAPITLTSSGGGGGETAYYVSGNTLFYAAVGSVYNPQTIYFRYGALNPTGSITWSISEGTFQDSNCLAVNRPSMTVDSSGTWWVADNCQTYFGSTMYFAVDLWKCTNPASCSWTRDSSGSVPWSTTDYLGKLTTLTAGKVSLIYGYNSPLYGRIYTPSVGWSGVAATGGSANYNFDGGSCVAIADTTDCGAPSFSTESYLSLSYNGGSPVWSSPTALATGCGGSESISTDGATELAASYTCGGSAVYYLTSVNGGSSWSATSAMTSAGSYPGFLASSFAIANNFFESVWMTGGSSPYNVNFAAIPFTLQTAATSTNPWSRPGLSPYESYFSEYSDYVSSGNGLVSVEMGTLGLPSRGLSFAPSLVYGEPYAFRNSGSPYLYDNYTGTSLGYGWSLNLPWLGANYLHLSDGQAYPYSWSGNTFQYNGVTNFALTKNAGGTYTLNMSSGTLYRFDTSKRLVSITDRTGKNAITFGYGTNGYISQVADTIGRTVAFSYNANNQLSSIASGTRTWTLGYTGSQLTSLIDPLNRMTTFNYAGTTGANAWLLSGALWPTGGKITYTYGSAPVGTEVTTYYATSRNVYYDSTHLSESQSISYSVTNGQVIWSNSTISDGTTTRSYLNYNFQSAKNLMKAYAYDGTKALQRITETDSETSGRTNATKIYSPSGTLLALSTSAYDNWGNLIYSKDNVGQQAWFSYANTNSANSFGSSGCTASFYAQTISSNIHDLMVGSCDYQSGSGTPQQQTYYQYDSNGNLLETKTLHNGGWLYTDYTYDQYGNALSVKNANGYYTYFRYSSGYSSAYLTKKSILVGTQNVTTTYTYDSNAGYMLSSTDPNGYSTSYQYDALGRVTQTTYPPINGVAAHSYNYYYDNNNTMKIIDPDGHATKAFFDGLARETNVQRYNGTTLYSTESYTYNWVDAVATKTTAAGNTYTYSYDWNGRLTKLTNPDSTYETTSYDYVGNTKTFADENGHQTVYAYDWNQRLVSVKQYNSSTNYYLTAYSYDLSGNTLGVTDAKGQATSYTYDDLNRLVQTNFPTSPVTTESRTYDNMGNLLTRTTANGSAIPYAYDTLNRLIQVSYPGSGGTVTYTYDPDGNRLSMVNPSARDYYAYDARDRVANSTEFVGGVKYQTLYQYDAASNIVQTTYPDGYALAMTYDGVNRRKTVGSFATVHYTLDDRMGTINYGNGEVATYAYDTRDRPTQIQDKYGTTKELSLNYTYDGTGNVLTLNTESYGYDWLNRLTSASGPWGSYTYAYDQTGNRIRMVQGSTTTVYCYGAFNRLSGYYTTGTCSSPTTSYTYDANGNTMTKTGGWSYSYDYENRMTKAVQSGATVQTNSYDGSGSRVRQVAGSSTFMYSYQGLNNLYEKNVTGSITTVTKHFYTGGLQVAKMAGTGVYYLHQDALGSTRLVATSTVSIKFSSNYVSYGQNYQVTGKETFMYTGKPYDSAIGLYYYGARYYDPSTGRFVTQDSYQGSKDDPMSRNLYIYARDNPERMVDPNGHMFLSAVMIDGVFSRPFVVQPAGTSKTITLTDVNKVSYTPSPTAVTVGTATQSADVTLTTVKGVNQYANTPTIGIESSTSTFPLASKCGVQPCQLASGGQAGAIVMNTVLTGATVAGVGLTAPLLPVPVLGEVIALADISLIDGLNSADQYMIDYGSSATWQGEFKAYLQGEQSGPLDAFLGWLAGI